MAAVEQAPVGGHSVVGTYKGRKFIEKQKESPGRVRIPRNVNLEALHVALEEDIAAVATMKREVHSSQEDEVRMSREQLIFLRKTHDRLKAHALALELRYGEAGKTLLAIKNAQERVDAYTAREERATAQSKTEQQISILRQHLEDEEENVRTALICRERYLFMAKRLNKEVLDTKRGSMGIQQQLHATIGEFGSCEAQYQQSKQELRTEEERLRTLRNKVSSRRAQTEETIYGLQRIMESRTIQLGRQEDRIRQRDEIMTHNSGDMRSSEDEKLARTCVVRSVYSTVLQRKMEGQQQSLSNLEQQFQQIKNVTGLSEVSEIISLYLARSIKNQQLHAQAEELRQRIESQRKDNQHQRHMLEELRSLRDATSGNRETYQEMDLVDAALGGARKLCDDSAERANRLRVTVDRLRDAVARFLSKVDNRTHAVATDDKLPEMFAQLDTKVSQMVKAVNAAVIKDDRAGGTNTKSKNTNTNTGGSQGNNTAAGTSTSTNGKFDGANVSRILYQNIMTTEPDMTPRNVRVTPRPVEEAGKDKKKILLGHDYESDDEDKTEIEDYNDRSIDDHQEPFVDRATVKKLSVLIQGRDARSSKPGHRHRHRSPKDDSTTG